MDKQNRDMQNLFNTMNEIPKEDEYRLEQRFNGFRERFIQSNESKRIGLFQWNYVLGWSGAAGLVIGAILIFMFSISPNHNSAFAKTYESLKTVQSISIQGWTHFVSAATDLLGSIPLSEKPDETKYEFSGWEWAVSDESFKSYVECGSFITYQDQTRKYQYNADTKELFISDFTQHKIIKEVTSLVFQIVHELEGTPHAPDDLGVKTIAGSVCFGKRFIRTSFGRTYYTDFWFDTESSLPKVISYSLQDHDSMQEVFHMTLTYNVSVPDEIQNYTPPESDTVSYGAGLDPKSNDWNEHLNNLAQRYKTQPLPETMELVPRSFKQNFQQYGYPASLPGLDDYNVYPVIYDFHLFIPKWKAGLLRISEDVQKIELNHDLVCKGTPDDDERILFMLDALGIKIREVEEKHSVWVARYDGRDPKPWDEITPPVNGDGEEIRIYGTGPAYVDKLFRDLMMFKDQERKANGPFVIDETGLPKTEDGYNTNIPLTDIRPGWENVSDEVIRQWFLDEFGITFDEEERSVTIYEVYKD